MTNASILFLLLVFFLINKIIFSFPPPSSSGSAIRLSVSCWYSMDLQPGKSLWGLVSDAACQSVPVHTYSDRKNATDLFLYLLVLD